MNNPRQRTAFIAILLVVVPVLLVAFIFASRQPQEVETPAPDLDGRTSAELDVDRVYGDLPAARVPLPEQSVRIQRNVEIPEDSLSQDIVEALPLTAPVYALSSEQKIRQATGQDVADNLSITGFPRKLPDGALSWFDEDYQIIVREEDQRLTVFDLTPDYSLPAPSIVDSVAVARRFLSESNLLFSDLAVDEAGAFQVAVSSHVFTTEPDAADGVSLNAVYVPLVRKTELGTIATVGDGVERAVVVDGNLEIQQVILSYRPLDLNSVGTYALRPYEEVLTEVRQLQHPIHTAGEEVTSVVQELRIENVEVKLYEGFSTEDFLQPVYVFTGIAIMVDGGQEEFEVIVPGIR